MGKNGYIRMTTRGEEEQAAMDSGVLNVLFTSSSQFLSQVGRVLILDILDDGFPAKIKDF